MERMNSAKSPVSFKAVTRSFSDATSSLQLSTTNRTTGVGEDTLYNFSVRTKLTNISISYRVDRDPEEKLTIGVCCVNLSKPHNNSIYTQQFPYES